MKRRTIKGKRLATAVTAAFLAIAMSATAFAADGTDLKVDIGGNVVDVEQLAEENGVNPYALKEAIEEGKNAEKASPFSNLVTSKPNTMESEAVESISPLERAASGTSSTKVSKKNQDSTAYVAASGAKTASGKTPALGMCAMHINVTNKTGSTSSSTVKLGTTIYMTKDVTVKGTKYSSFVVEDRGNPSNRTKFWIDIYFGLNNSTNYNAAINYGVKTVSYYYYY
ncbi:MAG: hypothetical protein HDR01_15335 [Lachnospiraceae bacterium]|nr:hypothetical protein [Lachnospiraceae bacterium]